MNEKGEIVIPLEYDASWRHESVWEQEGERQKGSVYAVSEGYIPLCKDGVWEMRNDRGELVIMPGVFEQIRPVYEGKCWVKKDGNWGVIRLGSTEENEEEEGEDGLHSGVRRSG